MATSPATSASAGDVIGADVSSGVLRRFAATGSTRPEASAFTLDSVNLTTRSLMRTATFCPRAAKARAEWDVLQASPRRSPTCRKVRSFSGAVVDSVGRESAVFFGLDIISMPTKSQNLRRYFTLYGYAILNI